MTGLTRVYFDFIDNFFCYLFVCALVRNTLHIKIKPHIFIFLLSLQALYAIPETLPFQSIINIFLSLFTIAALCYPQLKKVPIIFIKSQIYIILGQFIIQFFHTLFTLDFNVALANPYYSSCKETICTVLVYIIYVIYIHGKRMRQINRTYQWLFSSIILAICFALSYLTLYICQTAVLDSPIIPILFTVLYILIIACIEIYRRFIGILEENMQMQIQLEKSKLTAEYSEAIDKRLKELHSLRHDMRNHFLTIDGYAMQKRSDSIHQYISQISNKL